MTRSVRAFVTFLVFALVFAACGQSTTTPQGKKTLVVAFVAEPTTLDPHNVNDNNTLRHVYPMFDPLLREDAATGKVLPSLAESWDAAADGLSYTLHLKKNVKFHDGEPFDAAAVKFNLDRELDPNNPHYKDGNWNTFRSYLGALKSVEVIDPSTVKLSLTQVNSVFLAGLTTSAAYMASPKAINELGKDFSTKPAGTGPFRFVTWEKGTKLVLEKNPDYWGDKAKVDQLVLQPIVESESRLNALRTSTVNLTVDLVPDAVESVRSNSDLKLVTKPARSFWGIALNQKFEPFKKVQVRQAVSYAINREELTKSILKGTGVAAKGIFSEAYGDWVNTSAESYSYNPEKAKQLLRDAGYPNGFDVGLMIASSGSGMQQPKPMAEYIQSNLAAVGIRVKIEVLEFAAYVARSNQGQFDMSARGITPILADPTPMLNNFFICKFVVPNGSNWESWCDQDYDKVATSIATLNDPAAKKTAVSKAQEMLMNAAPWVFVDHENQAYYMTKNVSGLEIRGNYLLDFNKLDIQ